MAKVGTCLLANCQVALAKCIGDGECLENLVCLQLCNGRPDETECQASPAFSMLGALGPNPLFFQNFMALDAPNLIQTNDHCLNFLSICRKAGFCAPFSLSVLPEVPERPSLGQALQGVHLGYFVCSLRTGVAVSQIRCGDLYADKAVEAFTACAVSDKKCVPQRVDETSYPVPPDCALDKSFDLNNFQVSAAPCKPPQV